MRGCRTHRERKELYIKALEDEVLRLKEVYSNVSQDKDKLAEENRQLKTLLSQNGLSPSPAGPMDDLVSNPSLGYTSSASVSGSYAAGSSSTAFTPPMTTQSTVPPMASSGQQMLGAQQQPPHQHSYSQPHTMSQPVNNRVDYEQAGIDFVLTYENPDDPSKAYMSPPPH
jgi:hypothetical protein